MRFQDPWLLGLLLVVPLWWWWQRRQASAGGLQFSSLEGAGHCGSILARLGPGLLWGLRALAVAALIVALARPQVGRSESRWRTEGIDIVLAVDVSGSMQAMDFQLDGQPADRLSVVKNVVREFIRARPHDRIGMVVFARRAYLASPLTLDHDWLDRHLDRIRIGLVEDGTAIGAGLATAVNRLRDSEAKSRVVILLTDGVNNVMEVPPLAAADAAKEFGVRVYAIGAGSRGLAPLPVWRAGQLIGYRNVPVEVDEALLQEITRRTGGAYYRATDTESLREIYRQIDRLERREIETVKYQHWEEVFGWVAGPALAALLLAVALENTRLRRLP